MGRDDGRRARLKRHRRRRGRAGRGRQCTAAAGPLGAADGRGESRWSGRAAPPRRTRRARNCRTGPMRAISLASPRHLDIAAPGPHGACRGAPLPDRGRCRPPPLRRPLADSGSRVEADDHRTVALPNPRPPLRSTETFDLFSEPYGRAGAVRGCSLTAPLRRRKTACHLNCHALHDAAYPPWPAPTHRPTGQVRAPQLHRRPSQTFAARVLTEA
jgi:hypothetical protein